MASEKKQKKQKGSFFGFGKMTKDTNERRSYS